MFWRSWECGWLCRVWWTRRLRSSGPGRDLGLSLRLLVSYGSFVSFTSCDPNFRASPRGDVHMNLNRMSLEVEETPSTVVFEVKKTRSICESRSQQLVELGGYSVSARTLTGVNFNPDRLRWTFSLRLQPRRQPCSLF